MRTVEVRELGDTPLGLAVVTRRAAPPDESGRLTIHVYLLRFGQIEAGEYPSFKAAQAAAASLIKARVL
jgi:hypothetical protein